MGDVKWKWEATDWNGDVWRYENEPVMGKKRWHKAGGEADWVDSVRMTNIDWRNTKKKVL